MCPNSRLLKSYKIYPKLHEFSYLREKYFMYIYLNPFKEVTQPFTIDIFGNEICMAYEPLYVGKGTGGSGYRMNQHISEFIQKKDQNSIKTKWFKLIEDKMAQASKNKDHTKPWNWDEYKRDWVLVVRTFKTAKDLLEFEIKTIQTIGTLWDATGPLVNKIKN